LTASSKLLSESDSELDSFYCPNLAAIFRFDYNCFLSSYFNSLSLSESESESEDVDVDDEDKEFPALAESSESDSLLDDSFYESSSENLVLGP